MNRRETLAWLMLATFIGMFVVGCADEGTTVVEPADLNPPLGLWSVTGDGEVDLAWYTSNYESDLDGYIVYLYEGEYWNLNSQSAVPAVFDSLGDVSVSAPSGGVRNVTVSGLTNGQKYSFLVVAAKDDWSKISYTSNIVIDTPRPDVVSLALNNQNHGIGDCALKFLLSSPYIEVVDDTDPGAAVMFESFNAGAGKRSGLVGVAGRAQVQDLGFMSDWDLADKAPTDGYPASDFSVTAIAHHVYAVKTSGGHYAKIYVQSISGDPVANTDVATVWVAYQTDPNNPELAPPRH
jgi:hypothetical protein